MSSQNLQLKGMTWQHARGYDPLVAATAAWQQQGGVNIRWEQRSLQDFETYPIQTLAKAYDLIIIDHPHIGEVVAQQCLTALPALEDITQHSVGASVASYQYQGQTWAYPIDAAAQVLAIRPDLLERVPKTWADIMQLAEQGRVILPLRSPHVLMCFFYLTANTGYPCSNNGKNGFVPRQAGIDAMKKLASLVEWLDPACFEMDPIAALEQLAITQDIACVPFVYGYISYAIAGFRDNLILFHDLVSMHSDGNIAGSALGGTGIAVSAYSLDSSAAVQFAQFVAGSKFQRERYTQAGGQAGHRLTWLDSKANASCNQFYLNTLKTLDQAWLRPRHNGYMTFQTQASDRLLDMLKNHDFEQAMSDIEVLFEASFSG